MAGGRALAKATAVEREAIPATPQAGVQPRLTRVQSLQHRMGNQATGQLIQALSTPSKPLSHESLVLELRDARRWLNAHNFLEPEYPERSNYFEWLQSERDA